MVLQTKKMLYAKDHGTNELIVHLLQISIPTTYSEAGVIHCMILGPRYRPRGRLRPQVHLLTHHNVYLILDSTVLPLEHADVTSLKEHTVFVIHIWRKRRILPIYDLDL